MQPDNAAPGIALIAPAVVTIGMAMLLGAANSDASPQVQGYYFMGGFALGLLVGLWISMALGGRLAREVAGPIRKFFAAVAFGLMIWVVNLTAAWAGITLWMSFGGLFD